MLVHHVHLILVQSSVRLEAATLLHALPGVSLNALEEHH